MTMVDQADLLQTIAEISIAFAGFAGVVAAFGKFRLAPEAALFRIRLMVVVALLAGATGLIETLTPAIYVTGLFVGLGLCSFYFVMLIIAVDLEKD